MGSIYSLTMLDNSREKSTVRFNILDITAGNFDDTVAALSTLRTAIEGITLGVSQSDRILANDQLLSNTPPSDHGAQRENKWLAVYEDLTTHKLYRNEIPTADFDLLSTGSDKINSFPVGALGTFKTAFEAIIVSPDLNEVALQYLQYVGKRL